MGYRDSIAHLSSDDIARLSPAQRFELGMPRYNSAIKNMMDNMLPVRSKLRSLFNLEHEYDILPSYDVDANSQSDLAGAWNWYETLMKFENDRRAVYTFVEEASTFDILSSALDLYAEDATQQDPEKGRSYWVTGEDHAIVSEIERMLERINAEDMLFGWARSVAMYGDDFEQVIATKDQGVIALEYVSPYRITRVQDRQGRLRGFVGGLRSEEELRDEDKLNTMNISEPWDFIHFRLIGSNRQTYHGSSMLLNSRHCWRQLKIVEDSLVLYRVQRAPDRNVFYIEGNYQSVEEKFRISHEWRRHLRKKMYWNPNTGAYRQEYHPWAIDQDIYFPVDKGTNSRIERQPAGTDLGEIYDVDHLVNKLFSSLRIPKAYMGWEGDVNAKATLSMQDIRFARGEKRLQRSIIQGLTQLAEIHLAIKTGYKRREGTRPFTIHLAPISYLDALQRSELYRIQLELADTAYRVLRSLLFPQAEEAAGGSFGGGGGDTPTPTNVGDDKDKERAKILAIYIMRKYLGMPKDDIDVLLNSTDVDRALDKDSDDDSWVGRSSDSSDVLNSSKMRTAATLLEDSLSDDQKDRLKLLQELRSATSVGTIESSDPIPEEYKDRAEIYSLDEQLGSTNSDYSDMSCPVCSRKKSIRLYERDKKAHLICINQGCSFTAEVEEIVR